MCALDVLKTTQKPKLPFTFENILPGSFGTFLLTSQLLTVSENKYQVIGWTPGVGLQRIFPLSTLIHLRSMGGSRNIQGLQDEQRITLIFPCYLRESIFCVKGVDGRGGRGRRNGSSPMSGGQHALGGSI